VKKTKSAAVLSIFDAPNMTYRGRLEIAAWLHHQAHMLVRDGEEYAEGRFTARYRYDQGAKQ
jgi:hypothetical protein